MNKLLILTACLSLSAFAGNLREVQVSGEGNAKITFKCEGTVVGSIIDQKDGRIEIVLKPATLEAGKSKLNLDAPHVLISSLEVGPHRDRTDELLVSIQVNGTTDEIEKRTKLTRSGNDWVLNLDLPRGVSQAALKLLADEQAPVLAKKTTKEESTSSNSTARMWIAILLLAGVAGALAFGWRVLKAKTPGLGSRRYLIENMAQVPVGAQGKASVCLLKVGSEFVLVGVTAQSVTMLSSLPKLEAQYQDESSLERESFRQAVAEEAKRVAVTPASRVGFSV